MLHIKLNGKKVEQYASKVFDLMHTPDLLGGVKMSDIEIVQISIFLIELSEFIGFGYDLDDTQDGLRCWRNRIYILWLTPYLVTRIQVSDPGSKGLFFSFFKPALLQQKNPIFSGYHFT